MIDARQVAHVAKLARLNLNPEELHRFAVQLNHVLEYVDELNHLDTTDVAPMTHPLDLTNVFRDDAREPSLPRDEALANAPQKRDGFFLVPPVLEWAEE